MRPFRIVVGDVLGNRPAAVPFAQRHQPVETLVFDRPDEAFRVGVRVRCPAGRLDDPEPRLLDVPAYGLTPLRIAIADQYPVVYEGPLIGKYERAGHLLHEEGVGMRRGAQNLHVATRQIEDEERVVRDETRGCPDLGGEEVGAGDGASVGLEKGAPGGGRLGDGW